MRVVFRCVARRVRRRGARHEHHGVGSRSAGRSTSHTTYESAAAPASKPSLGAISQPRMVAATAAWEAPDHTPGRLLHSSVIQPMPMN